MENSKQQLKRAREEAEPLSNEDGPLPPSERAQAEPAEAKPAPARVPQTSAVRASSSSSTSSSNPSSRSKSSPSGERVEGATGGKGLGEPNPGSPEGMTCPQPGKGPGAVRRGDPGWKSRTEPTAPAGASSTPNREDPSDTDELTQSSQHDSQPARSQKRSLHPYTPRELWGKKLNKDYDEYKKASPERRKELWLSWTSLERRRVFCTASSHIGEEQRA